MGVVQNVTCLYETLPIACYDVTGRDAQYIADHMSIQYRHWSNEHNWADTYCAIYGHIMILLFFMMFVLQNTLYTDVDWTADHSCITTASTVNVSQVNILQENETSLCSDISILIRVKVCGYRKIMHDAGANLLAFVSWGKLMFPNKIFSLHDRPLSALLQQSTMSPVRGLKKSSWPQMST